MSTDLEQEVRISVLQHYSSKCTAHGTNLLAIAVASFAYVEAIDFITGFWRVIINSFFIPAFIVLFGHQIVRLLTWGRLSQIVLNVDPVKVGETWKVEIPSQKNMLHRLLYSCWIDFSRNPTNRLYSKMNSYLTNIRISIILGIILLFVMLSIQMFI